MPWYGWGGAGALALGTLGLALGAHPVGVHFYLIAWWAYILVADAAVWTLRGDSLLRDRPREFLVLAFWSIAVWNLFELFNFRLQNWFYVNVPRDPLEGALMSLGAYATVLPAILETYDLLRALGIWEGARVRPWQVQPWLLRGATAAGAAMLIAVLVWPRWAFPLVWVFAILLLDPLCYRLGAPSLLGHLAQGDPRPALRLLLAGLVCGALWELWNFWAHTKWIYTVPHFAETKWFEMPPLGFLGFPPFALECYVLVNALGAARRGRGWEHGRGRGAPRAVAAAAAALAVAFDLAVYAGIDALTVQSYSPRLEHIEGIPAETMARLVAVGVERPATLLRRTGTPERLLELGRQSGTGEAALRAAREAARLVDLKGLGAEHHNALRRIGIGSVSALAVQDPVDLRRRWAAAGDPRPPTLDQVRVWVGAARRQER